MKRTKNLTKTILFLIFTAMALSIIPLWLISVAIFNLGVYKIEESYSGSRLSATSFFARILEEELTAIQTQQYECVNDSNVQALSNQYFGVFNKFNEFMMVRFVGSYLLSRATSSSLIEEITLYFPNYGKKLSTINGYDDFTATDGERLNTIYAESSNSIAIENGQILFIASRPLYLGLKGALPSTIVITRLSNERFSELLNTYAQNTQEMYFAISRGVENTVIASSFMSDSFPGFEQPVGWKEGIASLQNDQEGYYSMEYQSRKYIVTWVHISNFNLKLYQISPQDVVLEEVFKFKSKVTLWQIAVILIALGFNTVVYFAIYKPIFVLRKAFRQVEEGKLDTRIEKTWSSEFQELFWAFNNMTEKLKTHINHEYQLRLLASDAELKQLQYQMSPHFLYNTYFILRGMLMDEEYGKAVKLAGLLGKYLKYIVGTNCFNALLKEEVEHARIYAEIQQIRFSKRVEMNFGELPPAYENLVVPRLIVQPLIENIFEHGLKNVVSDGLARVQFAESADGGFDISVEDNGVNIDDEKLADIKQMLDDTAYWDGSKGIALVNMKRRIQATFGPTGKIYVGRSPLGGMKVVIHLEGGSMHV